MSIAHLSPEFIVGDLLPFYVISYNYEDVNINGLSLKIINSYEIKSCYGETKHGSLVDHTAYIDDNKYSFLAYDNLLADISSLTDTANVYVGKNASKYLFDTYEEAEKVLTKIMYYSNYADLSNISNTLMEKYPEAII